MPPFEIFSQWLEAISVHHWVLPTIGTLGAGGWPHPWTPAVLGFPTQPFVQLWDWNDADGFGHIRTRRRNVPHGYQVRDVDRHCLEAVYRRFEQLAIHGPVGAGSWALINGAYNINLHQPYCWQVGAYPGPAGFETCPDHILCPFLAPIMFLFCGVSSAPATPTAAITYHNSAAHAFALHHGLGNYIPSYSYPPAPLLPEPLPPTLDQADRMIPEINCNPCEQCPLWQLLATNAKYRDWTQTQTIGGTKILEFRYLPASSRVEIRPPRPAGNEVQDYPKTFSELQFKIMCCRFSFVTRTGPNPPWTFVGNTQFNDPGWTPPNGVFVNPQIDPPYVVAVVRKLLEDRAGYCPMQGNCG